MVRIMIDDVEITSASQGSGFAMMGDMDIEYIDHIEIYSLNPSFALSSEPSLVFIKLYTKVASRDRGGKVALSVANRGYDKQSAYYTDTVNDWSYFFYAGNIDDKREKPQSLGKDINRDKKQQNYLFKLTNEDHKFFLEGENTKKHLSINISTDATPLDTSVAKYNRQTFSYTYEGVKDLKFLFTYERYDYKMFIEDDTPILTTPLVANNYSLHTNESVLSSELNYKFEKEFNTLLVGIKYRSKEFDCEEMSIGGVKQTPSDFNRQNVSSVFLENAYKLQENSLITLGLQGSAYQNDGGKKDENLFLARLGYTYTNEEWVFKIFAYTMQAAIEGYMYNSLFTRSLTPKSQKIDAISQETKYKHQNHEARVLFNITYSKDSLGTDFTTKQLSVMQQRMSFNSVLVDYTYHFDEHNKLMLMGSYDYIKHLLPQTIDEYNGYVRMLNTYRKIDFFSELVYYYIDTERQDRFDLNMGLTYSYSDDLKIKLKGENLLDKAYADRFYRVDGTYIDVTPFDRRVYIGLEYLF
jgi:iron complex outermembrane receptor protein